jgi:hypothetical protein
MRVELPSTQDDGSPNWVEVRSPDDFLAEEMFAVHRAVRITSGTGGETSYSPREMEDDTVNAFLGAAITAWSFPVPIPVNNLAAVDKTIGRAMKYRDWAVLRKAVKPLLDELDALDREDPKASSTG